MTYFSYKDGIASAKMGRRSILLIIKLNLALLDAVVSFNLLLLQNQATIINIFRNRLYIH